MDAERDDYADNDLPPPRQLPPLHIILAFAGIALLVAMVVGPFFFGEHPKVRD
jgi:hypothetical protein